MPGRISDSLVSTWLSELKRVYVALHYENPEVAGAYASEVFGGGYSRVAMTFSSPTTRGIWNITGASFEGLNSVTVTHIAAWDAAVNGNYLFSAALATPVRVLQGKSVSIPVQTFAVSIT